MDSSVIACISYGELLISCRLVFLNLAELTSMFRAWVVTVWLVINLYPPAVQSGVILGVETRFLSKGVAGFQAS